MRWTALLACLWLVQPAFAQNGKSQHDEIMRTAKERLDKAMKVIDELEERSRRLTTDHPVLMKLPNVEAWYLVNPDGSLKLHRGTWSRIHEEQWKLVKKIVGRPVQEIFTTFVAYRTPESETKPAMGLVVRTQLDSLKGGIGLNQVLYRKNDVLNNEAVLIMQVKFVLHEYLGHVRVTTEAIANPNSQGCVPHIESLHPQLTDFARLFWTHCEKGTPKPERTSFTTDYAMTSLYEDYAESVTSFVLCSRPKGNGTVSRKLEFFWKMPEHVNDRARIRKELAPAFKILSKVSNERCA